MGKQSAEAMIQQALKEDETIDLMNVTLPFRVANWSVLVQPAKPKKSFGSIALVDETQQVEEIKSTIGRVIAVGPSAFIGKTASGIPANLVALDVEAPEQLLGLYVLHQPHTGVKFRLERYKTDVRFIDLENILAVGVDPDDWRFYIGVAR